MQVPRKQRENKGLGAGSSSGRGSGEAGREGPTQSRGRQGAGAGHLCKAPGLNLLGTLRNHLACTLGGCSGGKAEYSPTDPCSRWSGIAPGGDQTPVLRAGSWPRGFADP